MHEPCQPLETRSFRHYSCQQLEKEHSERGMESGSFLVFGFLCRGLGALGRSERSGEGVW